MPVTGSAGQPLVVREDAGGIATVTLDSPRNRNALSARLTRELRAHLDGALADPAVREGVLASAGSASALGQT